MKDPVVVSGHDFSRAKIPQNQRGLQPLSGNMSNLTHSTISQYIENLSLDSGSLRVGRRCRFLFLLRKNLFENLRVP